MCNNKALTDTSTYTYTNKDSKDFYFQAKHTHKLKRRQKYAQRHKQQRALITQVHSNAKTHINKEPKASNYLYEFTRKDILRKT